MMTGALNARVYIIVLSRAATASMNPSVLW